MVILIQKKYRLKFSELLNKFHERFADFENLEKAFLIFRNPFSVDVSEIPAHFQHEIIELKCDSVLKEIFSSVDVATFYQNLGPDYPKARYLASRIMSLFGSTYVCEQFVSLM